MAKDNLETLRLALELMRRIPRSGKVSAAQLREQLAEMGMVRDLRTIQRQLAMLCEVFGIERDTVRPVGYRWKAQSRGLSVAAMSEHEALLLMLAQQHLAALLPPSLMKSMDGFFAEARHRLDPHGNRKHAKQWLSKVRVISESMKLVPPRIRAGVLETVSQSLYANRWLQVRYRDADGKLSDKEVMPLGLAQLGSRLYLVFRYEAGGDDRSLALHRMQSVRATTLEFEPPKDFDFERFDTEGRLTFGTGKHVRLSFRITRKAGAHLRESLLSTDQTLVEEGDGLKITATVPDSLILKRWLLSFGKEMTQIRKQPVGVPEPPKPKPRRGQLHAG